MSNYNGYVLERERAGLDPIFTQELLAKALGISQPTYSRKEKGLSPLHVDEMANRLQLRREQMHVLDPRLQCPYGQPGDRLWVRETHAFVPRTAFAMSDGVQQTLRPDDDHVAAIYRAAWERSRGGIVWRPSIHMPRWASRITLEITCVRVERLQDVSDDDAIAEGVGQVVREKLPKIQQWGEYDIIEVDAVAEYRALWESINGPGSWRANPWVWVIEFKRVEVQA